MLDRPVLRIGLHCLFAMIASLAIALALGAVWMAIALHVPSASWWFALPTGLAMGYATRTWVTSSRAFSMVLAAAGTWLAAVYMQCLFMGLKLAAVMGLGYLETLRRAGAAMLLALVRASADTQFLVACLVGMLLALAVAGHRSRGARLKRHPVP